MTENDLIQGCIKKDRRCQNELYKRYYPLMSSIALRYCKELEDAKQAVNHGFFKVLQNISTYNQSYSLATWLRTIMVNHLVDEFRKNKKHISSLYLEDFSEAVEELIDYNSADQHYEEGELRDMLNKLPDVTKTVFNLFAIDGYKHREIAEHLGISEGTSKWHVNEARRRLQHMLEKKSNTDKKLMRLSHE